ncbi:MAG: hypothetical protein Ta2D_02950 [Rickettsiales bacterium]|nr:MAG: hypothetical protein Ta2D_02950 [Rickettsiales bacterium]
MTDQNKKEEELQEDDISVGQGKGNKIMLLAFGAIGISVLFYLLFFSEPAPEDGEEKVDVDTIVKSDDKYGVAGREKGDNLNPILESLETAPTVSTTDNANIQANVPDLPSVPEMSADLKQQLSGLLPPPTEKTETNTADATYTKEEVDAMIEERMRKMLQEQMAMQQNNRQQNEDGTPVAGQESDMVEDDSVNDEEMVLDDNGNIVSTTKRRKKKPVEKPSLFAPKPEPEEEEIDLDGLEGDGTKPTKIKKKKTIINSQGQEEEVEIEVPNMEEIQYNEDGTIKTEQQIMDEQARAEEKELNRLAKERTMQERKQAPMFAVGGGEGGGETGDRKEEDSIILTFMDSSKVAVTAKKPDVTPQQVNDLTTMILQGKVISAVLETAIDTSVQETTVRAVITRDVFAEEGKNILIPKGSRIIGDFAADEATVMTGKVKINWTRIIRVDGITLNITSIATDRLGRGGISGELETKYAQRMANAFLSNIVTVGSAMINNKLTGAGDKTTSTISDLTGGTVTTVQDPISEAIGQATQKLTDEAQSIVDSIKQDKPVVRVPQGERITIMVTQDVSLPLYKKEI